uniref:Uncharacterized protein n=1 Tax=Salmo trutta TaxID=8032 RepID=A0A673WQW0_SALTR
MKLPQKRQQRKGRYKKDDKSATKNMESNNESREPQAEHERHWDGLTQYFGINDRFQPPACSKPAPKVTKMSATLLACLSVFNAIKLW